MNPGRRISPAAFFISKKRLFVFIATARRTMLFFHDHTGRAVVFEGIKSTGSHTALDTFRRGIFGNAMPEFGRPAAETLNDGNELFGFVRKSVDSSRRIVDFLLDNELAGNQFLQHGRQNRIRNRT